MTDIAQLAYQVDSSDLDRAEKALDRNVAAAGRAQTATGKLQKAWGGLTRIVGSMVSAQALLSGALSAVTVQAARYINQTAMMAQQIGLTTESLTGLRYAAEQMSTVSGGQFDMALRRMTRRIAEAAAGGGPAADALKRMGLEARELARLKPDEQFRKLADAMKNSGDQGQKLRATMAIFDTEGMPLVTMLSEGADAIREFESEADRLGITIDQRTAAAAQRFTAEMTTLKGAGQGLKTQIAAEMLPTLVNLTSRLTETAKGASGVDQAARVAGAGLKIFASIGTIVVGVFKTVGEALGGIAAAIVSLLSGRFSEAWDITKNFSADFVGNIKQTGRDVAGIWDDVEIDAKPLTDAAAGDLAGAESVLDAGSGRLADAADHAYQQVEQAIGRIQRELATFGMTEDEVILFDIQVMGADQEQISRVTALTTALRALKEAEDERENNAASKARAEGVLADLDAEIAALGMSSQAIAARTALQRAGVSAESEYGRQIIDTVGRLYKHGEAVDYQIAKMDALRDGARGFLADLKDGVSVWGAMKNALDRFADRLLQVVEDRLIEQLFGQMGTAQTGASGGFWSAVMGMFGFGGGRRNGGGVRGDRLYEVGEGGEPELLKMGAGKTYLIPGNDGRVEPARAGGAAPGGMGAPQININVSGNANVESATARRNSSGGFDVEIMLKQLEGQIAGNVSNGGNIAQAIQGRYGLRPAV